MHDICIIGTIPPCPRCGLLKKMVEELIVEENITANVRHITYTDQEAIDFSKKYDLFPGTAKDVARILNQPIDLAELNQVKEDTNHIENIPYAAYNTFGWTYALDLYLRPYENNAKNAGILMTPILIIDGDLKHSGSVPTIEEIKNWLNQLHS
ncbi:MAG: thioredoxin family protein [Acetobacterium sp.]|nr:thioredoxin family protein [Acetobacterium sp.]